MTFNANTSGGVTPERSGPIPLVAGTTTIWNITISDPGESKVGLEMVNVPQSTTITAIVNGSVIPVVGQSSTISLNGNGSAVVELQVSTTDTHVGDNSSFYIDVIEGGGSPSFGILGFIVGTGITTLIAVILAVPAGIGCAIFLSQYCSRRTSRIIKPVMEILIGIPSVIFGLWGALTLGPLLASTVYPGVQGSIGSFIPFFSGDIGTGMDIFTASIVLAIMIFPLVMALSYEAISAVPSDIKDASISLGATKWQTNRKVVLTKARSGIMGSIILGVGRAIGETMAVLMIMNYSTGLPSNIFSSGATMTTAIAANFGSAYADETTREGLFAIALLLLVFVLGLNLLLWAVTNDGIWLSIKKRTRKMRSRLAFMRSKWMARRDRSGAAESKAISDVQLSFRPSKGLVRNDKMMTILLYVVATIIIGIVAFIIGDILIQGSTALQLTYLTQTQLSGGGFLNAIFGSLLLISIAILVSAPLTIMAALYISEYSEPNSRLYRISYMAVSTLSSTPSIIYGAFGFMLFVLYLGFGFSLLAGGLTLGFMIIPILYISSFEAIRTVPQSYRDASYALGVSKWATIKNIVFPCSFPSITSGIMLGIGRAIGETAAILFTAGFATFVTTSMASQVGSMPVLIYDLYDKSAGSAAIMQEVYAAALILIVMVIMLNIVGRLISHHYSKKYIMDGHQ